MPGIPGSPPRRPPPRAGIPSRATSPKKEELRFTCVNWKIRAASTQNTGTERCGRRTRASQGTDTLKLSPHREGEMLPELERGRECVRVRGGHGTGGEVSLQITI